MNCEEANLLISARIDGELSAEESAALDAHLAACEDCRQTLTETELADAALLRAFSSRQEAAGEVADRAMSMLGLRANTAPSNRISSRTPKFWIGFAAAAAAGFIAAIVLLKPGHSRTVGNGGTGVVRQVVPVAHLTLATGDVFMQAVNQPGWRAISVRDAIDRGDAVRTALTSKCELQLPDGSCVRLDCATEARFTGERTIQVVAGQVGSKLPHHAASLCVVAGATNVTAGGAGNETGAQFDLAYDANTATLTVQRGRADVTGTAASINVHRGQVLLAPPGAATFACTAMAEPAPAAPWQDDLLVLKPANDPEVAGRIEQLLAQIAAHRAVGEWACESEQQFRARGQAWCPSMLCYLHNPSNEKDRDARRTAAILLADLAPPANVPDLIALLDDEDGQVRSSAAAALHRLTGSTLGFAPADYVARRDPAASQAWKKWWDLNQRSYALRK